QGRRDTDECACGRRMLLALDDHHRVALENDEDLLLIAVDLVVLRNRVALLDLDDVQAERPDAEPAPDERPPAVRFELGQVLDREPVAGHARNDRAGTGRGLSLLETPLGEAV